MSSVTRFIRQIPVSTTYYDAAGVTTLALSSLANPLLNTLAFTFVPGTGNYVGNYPPGFMLSGNPALNAAIASAAQRATANNTALVLRDMGKTIQAPYAVAASLADAAALTVPAITTATPVAFFRQVQLISPTALSVGQGALGGSLGSTFGVLGGQDIPNQYSDYLTFYIPVSVAGVRANVVSTAAYAIAGGQM
jgi:hypothetical protein